mmetsp:Transcript_93381/g.263588  ORF Transcript_93381/g.263588 Transcript_93381/m.263588 type:complete len:201 (+) Transcript_93381:146-748(+)
MCPGLRGRSRPSAPTPLSSSVLSKKKPRGPLTGSSCNTCTTWRGLSPSATSPRQTFSLRSRVNYERGWQPSKRSTCARRLCAKRPSAFWASFGLASSWVSFRRIWQCWLARPLQTSVVRWTIVADLAPNSNQLCMLAWIRSMGMDRRVAKTGRTSCSICAIGVSSTSPLRGWSTRRRTSKTANSSRRRSVGCCRGFRAHW